MAFSAHVGNLTRQFVQIGGGKEGGQRLKLSLGGADQKRCLFDIAAR